MESKAASAPVSDLSDPELFTAPYMLAALAASRHQLDELADHIAEIKITRPNTIIPTFRIPNLQPPPA